jgi:hypothetical protein
MMKFVERAVIVLLALAAVFAAHQIAAVTFALHGWEFPKAGDWATWIGAIGTIGTLIGTVWLATSETRRRHHQETARGYIAAAALAPRLQLLTLQLSSFHAKLCFVDYGSGQNGTPKTETADFLDFEYEHATPDELMALASMPNNCATKLAYAQSQLATVRAQIKDYVSRARYPDKPLHPRVVDVWRPWISDLYDRVNVLARQCQDAANTHAVPPTQYELFGDSDDSEYDF